MYQIFMLALGKVREKTKALEISLSTRASRTFWRADYLNYVAGLIYMIHEIPLYLCQKIPRTMCMWM